MSGDRNRRDAVLRRERRIFGGGNAFSTSFQIVIPGKAGDSWRDPESKNFENIWIPASTGMTAKACSTYSRDFWVRTPGQEQLDWARYAFSVNPWVDQIKHEGPNGKTRTLVF